jgi:hypothetical protein
MNMTFQNMSLKELKSLSEAVAVELESRRSARRDELIQAVCDAMNNLYQEFPGIELNIPCYCSECNTEDEVDVMYVLCSERKMKPGDFSIW